MSFSSDWNQIYLRGEQQSRWPWSDLVTLVSRLAKRKDNFNRVLELGFGFGANIPFFEAIGMEYFGIDGSTEAKRLIEDRFPKLKDRLAVGDFTREIPFLGEFDLVFDRAAVTFNSESSLMRLISTLKKLIRKDGLYIGVDWYATDNTYFNHGGVLGEDKWTKEGFTSGPFAQSGPVHFSDPDHIKYLFSDFEIIHMEHRSSSIRIPNTECEFNSWNFAARRK